MSRKTFKAAAVQFEVQPGDVEKNLDTARTIMRSLGDERPSLVVFPEYCWTAFPNPRLAERVPDGRISRALAALAKEYSTHIVGGSLVETDHGRFYLTALLFGPRGRFLGRHRKISLVGGKKTVSLQGKNVVGMKDEIGEGVRAGESIAPVKTPLGEIGLLLGADLDTPEASRTHVLKGAQILAVPVSFESRWTEDIEFLGRARAYENSSYVIIANRTGEWQSPDGPLSYGGGSVIVSPLGEIISSAGSRGASSSYAIASLDLDELARVRSSFNMLNLRSPRSYQS